MVGDFNTHWSHATKRGFSRRRKPTLRDATDLHPTSKGTQICHRIEAFDGHRLRRRLKSEAIRDSLRRRLKSEAICLSELYQHAEASFGFDTQPYTS